jgi:hypothetical protein
MNNTQYSVSNFSNNQRQASKLEPVGLKGAIQQVSKDVPVDLSTAKTQNSTLHS